MIFFYFIILLFLVLKSLIKIISFLKLRHVYLIHNWSVKALMVLCWIGHATLQTEGHLKLRLNARIGQGGRALRLGRNWEVAASEIAHLGSSHLGKYPWEVAILGKSFGKVPNINSRTLWKHNLICRPFLCCIKILFTFGNVKGI